MNATQHTNMKTDILADIDPKAIGYIIGLGCRNIRSIEEKFGNCCIYYSKIHKRFEIQARTQKICTTLKEALYAEQEAWKASVPSVPSVFRTTVTDID